MSSEDGAALASTPRTAFIFLFDTSLVQSTRDPGNRNQTGTSSTQFHGIPKDFKVSVRKCLNESVLIGFPPLSLVTVTT